MDEDGVMLDPPARTAFDVPVLTGVRPDQTRAIRALRTRRMLRLLEDLGDYRKRISEVDVADLDNLRVTLKVEGKAVVLMLGDHNFHGRFQNFVDHYKEIQKRIAGVSALDLRLDRIITVPSGARHD